MKNKLTGIVHTIILSITLFMLGACSQSSTSQVNPETLQTVDDANGIANPKLWPAMKSKLPIDAEMEAKISTIVKDMTVEQKLAQMIQPEIRAMSIEQMRQYGFGSYLNGGGAFPDNDKYATMADWVELADKYYAASIDDSLDGSTIPTMWGTDAVHGHNNVIGATLFPHNIALGATNNPSLMRKIGAATAKVVEVTGIDWAFAPTVAVVRDVRWGRTYEGYSEDPDIVKVYAKELVEGMQGEIGNNFLGDGKVISTAKHFLGDGGTVKGDDQGDNIDVESELIRLHAQGYISALDAGVQTVMASFNTWHGIKMHGNKSLLTDVLKDRMGFDGLVVGDWDGHGQVAGCSNTNCPQAIIAGVDIIMVPFSWKEMYDNTLVQINDGTIPMARIDDAVTRILRVKMRAGLFERGAPSKAKYAAKQEEIGSQVHRDVAQQAVRESLVLLKNKNAILPLDPSLNILVAGDGADNIGKQSGGWTISWQGTGNTNVDFPGATSIYNGIQEVVEAAGGKTSLSVEGHYQQKPDVAIIVFGENPYAEMEGDIANLEFQKTNKIDLKLLKKFKDAGIPVISVFITGRPLWINAELNASDAFVVAWLPGTEGQGVADVLFKNAKGEINYDFKGRLSYSWPKIDTQADLNRNDEDYQPLFPYGYGLTYDDKDTLADNLNEVAEEIIKRSFNDPLELFRNRSLDGLSVFVGDKANWVVPVAHSIVTTQDSNNLKLQSVNWKVQEDARQITWSGDSAASSYIAYDTSRDHSDYLTTKTALSFDLRVDVAPQGILKAVITCGEACEGAIDMQKQVTAIKVGEWKKISIDLACFVDAGVKFDNTKSPFGLRTDKVAQVSYANVSYLPGQAEKADISCSK